MSQLNVDTIKKADGTGNLSVPAETGTVVTTASSSLGRRNLIINGAMQVAQRGTSETGVTASGYYICDRFRSATTAEQTETHEQSTDAPDGFSNSYKVTVTTADSSIEANDYAAINQKIEAQNLQHLQYGTSGAKQITVSFYVKASATGTYAVSLYQEDAASNNYNSQSYTISSADTWEYKTVTFDGNTGDAIDNNNDEGLSIFFFYSAGSNWTSGTANTWGASTNFAVGHTTNLVSTINSTFQITGVQLEVGSVATPFEHRSHGEELALCQRYYIRYPDRAGSSANNFLAVGMCNDGTNNTGLFQVHLPCTMRANPTLGSNGTFRMYNGGTLNLTSGPTLNSATVNTMGFQASAGAGLSTLDAVMFGGNNDSDAYLEFKAEL